MATPVIKPPPSPAARATAKSTPAADRRLRLDELLNMMVADGLVAAAEAEKLARSRTQRFEHPLELIADQRWKSLAPPHKTLTLEWLVEWLAGKLGIRYQHIDPLKIDLAAVTQTMSNAYAERYRILPIAVNRDVLTVATGQPFVRALGRRAREDPEAVASSWSSRTRSEIRRYLGEFFNLARSMKKGAGAQQGRAFARAQLRAAGRARQARQPRRQRPARRPHRRLAVAVRVRAARVRHPRRAAARRRPGALPHRRRAAPGLLDPDLRC